MLSSNPVGNGGKEKRVKVNPSLLMLIMRVMLNNHANDLITVHHLVRREQYSRDVFSMFTQTYRDILNAWPTKLSKPC